MPELGEIGGNMAGKVKIELQNTGGLKFEDEFISVTFGFKSEEKLNELKSMPIVIKNKTAKDVSVRWDYSVFIDPNGDSCRIVPKESPITAGNASLEPTTIKGNSELKTEVIPNDYIEWSTKPVAQLSYKTLLETFVESKVMEFKVFIAVEVADDVKPYEMTLLGTQI